VTYGTFVSDESGSQFPVKEVAERFFLFNGSKRNSIELILFRSIYLSVVLYYGLKAIGASLEAYYFLDDTKAPSYDIIKRVKAMLSSCGNHCAIPCFNNWQ